MTVTELGSPFPTRFLDRLEQRALARRAAGAGVAGEVGVAEVGAARGEAGAEVGHADDRLAALFSL